MKKILSFVGGVVVLLVGIFHSFIILLDVLSIVYNSEVFGFLDFGKLIIPLVYMIIGGYLVLKPFLSDKYIKLIIGISCGLYIFLIAGNIIFMYI